MDGIDQPVARPRFQFHLRSLLALTTLVAWAFGWLGAAAIAVAVLGASMAMIEAGCDARGRWFDCLMRNLLAFFVISLVFGAIGWGLMCGSNPTGWFGTDDFLFGPMRTGCPSMEEYNADGENAARDPEVDRTFNRNVLWTMHHVFLAWAVTMGHVVLAGRANRRGYLLYWIVAAGLIYPLLGNWVHEDIGWVDESWLSQLGFDTTLFRQFPMITLMAVAGWSALAGAVAFRTHGAESSRSLSVFSRHCRRWLVGLGYVLPVALALGLLALSIASIVSDAGQAGVHEELLAMPVAWVATGAATAVAGLVWKRRLHGPLVCGGLFAGTITAAAGAIVPTISGAVVCGFLLGLLIVLSSWLLARLRFDDAGGIAAVLGVSAAWNSLAGLIHAVAMELPGITLLGDFGSWSEIISEVLDSPFRALRTCDPSPWISLLALAVAFVWVMLLGCAVFLVIRRLPSLQTAEFRNHVRETPPGDPAARRRRWRLVVRIAALLLAVLVAALAIPIYRACQRSALQRMVRDLGGVCIMLDLDTGSGREPTWWDDFVRDHFAQLHGICLGNHDGPVGPIVDHPERIGDAEVETLCRMQGMSEVRLLELGGTAITDDTLEHLAGLANLESLDLRQTGVSNEAVARLQQALPDCQILK